MKQWLKLEVTEGRAREASRYKSSWQAVTEDDSRSNPCFTPGERFLKTLFETLRSSHFRKERSIEEELFY